MSNTNIEHFNCHYLIPAEHPAPAEVQARLDMVAQNYVAAASGKWLTQLLEPHQSALWFIRELHIDFSVDIGSIDNHALAELWARQLALSIARIITAGTDTDTDTLTAENIKYFSDRPTYIAHFVADLAQGRAEHKWYYHPFDAVSTLSTSAAIRTVMTREPDLIPAVLIQLLTRRHLEAVIASLSEYDAHMLYEQAFPYEDAEVSTHALVELALALWSHASLRLGNAYLAMPRFATPQNALRLAATMCERIGTTSCTGLRATIDLLLGFANILHIIAQPAKLVSHLLADELTEAIALLRDTPTMSAGSIQCLSFLQQIAASDDTVLRRIATTVATSLKLEPGSVKASQNSRHHTTTFLGGLFLLLPSLIDLQLHELIANTPYPAHEQTQIVPLLRYLLYLKCFGSLYAQWPDIAYDPTLLLLAGLADTPSPEAVLHLDQSTTAEMNVLCLQALLERLARRKLIMGHYLYAELINDTAHSTDSILLLRDMQYDNWVFAAYLSIEDVQTAQTLQTLLRQGLTAIQQAVDLPVAYLVLGNGFAHYATPETFHLAPAQLIWTEPLASAPEPIYTASTEDISLWTAPSQTLPAEVQSTIMRYLKRRQPASKDLHYFNIYWHKHSLLNNKDVDLTWTLVARTLLRAFARRLIGFDNSSSQYLYDNFLLGTSTVSLQQDLLEVHLPCSPLHMILRMAGVNGQTYVIPWLDDTQVTLVLTC
ncbi:MAG: hypothetical protein NVSMB49_25340 [Ktedonobacteraceae bacterium]